MGPPQWKGVILGDKWMARINGRHIQDASRQNQQLLLVEEEVKSEVQCGIQQIQFRKNSESNRFNLEILAFRDELADQFTARISIFRTDTDCFKLGEKAEIMALLSLFWMKKLLQMAYDS